MLLEINFGNKKWLIIGTYKPPSLRDSIYKNELHNILSFYSALYDNILLVGDLNMSMSNNHLKNLCDAFSLNSLITEPTCFKEKDPTTIDHFLTNKRNSFISSSLYETGLSDHHKLILTFLKSTFRKGNPKFLFYRSYKSFNVNTFQEYLKTNISNCQTFDTFYETFQKPSKPLCSTKKTKNQV